MNIRGFAIAATAAAFASPRRRYAAEMAWTATSYVTRMDQSTGEFARRGLAMFKDGEVVPFRIEGKITSIEGNAQTYRTKIVYTFQDGSTLVQEGEGRRSASRPSATRSPARAASLPAPGGGKASPAPPARRARA
jgi:hypothetical protein